MERRTFLTTGGALLLTQAGCSTTGSVADNAPKAQTPLLSSVSSVNPRSCAWVTAMPTTAGTHEILPSGHPTGDVRVVIQAPYPSKISIDIRNQIFLREFDNTQSPGEGSYKINSINLAANKDIFDWDVTITPPSSQRVEPSFNLNIANVSINPAYSGAERTSAPLVLQLARAPVGDLDAWLTANPNVANAIVWEDPAGAVSQPQWYADRKQKLLNRFTSAWNTTFLLLEDPPRNTLTLADTDPPTTVISEPDAWDLYLTYVAYSLAAEIGGWTSWSIAGYSNDDLAMLLDSRKMFQWNNARNGYEIHEGNGPEGVVPASPWTTMLFLYENGIYTCRSRVDVIARLLDWCRDNLVHFSGGFEAKNMQDQWQYRGCPPVFRIIRGTPMPSSTDPNFARVLHRTAGCWGTTAFLRAVLRVVNIPVKLDQHQGHALPNFTTEGLYLSHGDDPYNRLSKATPPFPARELLIDQATRDSWFGNGVPAAQQSANVGRRTRELGVQYLSNELLRNQCKDVAAGKGHADGDVFASLSSTFTVAELEAQNLWGRLDAKIAGFGGCTQIP